MTWREAQRNTWLTEEAGRQMDDEGGLGDRFEANRARLRGVAYRLLGSLSEAEDAVQEAWLRLNDTDTASIENLNGWLTTVCLLYTSPSPRDRTRSRMPSSA